VTDGICIRPGGKSRIAADDVDGLQYPRIKLSLGGDGVAADISDANPLPVAIISGGGGGGSSGGLTNTELRASAVPVSGAFYQATQPISGAVSVSGSVAVTGTFYQATQPVSIAGAVSVTGTFWQATQPVSIAGTVAVSGPLTDAQLRATAVPVSGTFFQATQPISGTVTANAGTGTFAISAASLPLPSGAATETTLAAISTKTLAAGQATMTNSSPVVIASNQSAVPVSGTFWQATQPVSIASMPSTPVTGTFWQVTQPVSGTVTANAGTGTFAVSGTFWQATQPVSGTFWQSTQPVSGTVTITPPTLTKGTQGATGLSVQELKDAGRSCLAMTAEFAFAQTAETLLTMTLSVDGAATSTFSSRAITSGKKFRLQSVTIEVESLGSGTAPQRAYLRLRRNTAGATTASSALQAVWGCVNNTAIVKSAAFMDYEVPDGLEMNGDGTATFGFTLETPDWVSSTATGRAKMTMIGFEF
jgi:hypothetical protein